jgi:hypothetical protein
MDNVVMPKIDQPYRFSFTTCSLRQQETLKLAKLYLQHGDWNAVRKHAIEGNVLQQRTTNSSKKLCQELISRLRTLSDDELAYLVQCPESEKAFIIWLAICKRYRFIREFAIDLFSEHYFNQRHQIQLTDFDVFFSSKFSLHDKLGDISNATKQKVRQIVFNMLHEAGLVDRANNINYSNC